MFGLADCNNFYASCERVFNPSLRGRPIIVLSSNDGCIIARSNEAKAIGIPMGAPVFKVKGLIERHGVHVFSSNFTLYGDMSARIMSLLARGVPDIEIYSVDEAFLDLSGIKDERAFGLDLVRTVVKSCGVPISLGIAPTKTLAKIANRFAKKYPGYNGVCIMDAEEKRIKALQRTDIGDVWGIGRRFAKKLRNELVENAYDFSRLPVEWVRKEMTVVGERMHRELNGIPCLNLETDVPDKKQICTSRSFDTMITDIGPLSEAVAHHAASCARKLREQDSCAVSVMVFIGTNRFRDDLPQSWLSTTARLPTPCADTPRITAAAVRGLKSIFKEGHQYKKAGVIITEIIPRSSVQTDLFDPVDLGKSGRLMTAVDTVNGMYNGPGIRLATEGVEQSWKPKKEHASARYTTDIRDIIRVKA